MVETISPVVHGGRRFSYWLSAALYGAAATLAASAVGLLLGAAGALLGAPWGRAGLWLVVAVAALYAARAATGLPVPIPARRRQVPDWWRTFYSPEVAALLYGAGLGVGWLTFLSHGTFAVVAVAALASGDPLLGAAIHAPFGLARGLLVLLATSSTDAEAGAEVVDRIEDLGTRSLPRGVNALTLLGIMAVAASALL